ncbi:hypothetical protein H5410_006927 [Solanum commersonii]|uniref:Ubiquitin-like protease family profile domain-containing protein n=1 Tax=Solanum commersonii TaxID=4109 RepID=A0A9J6AAP2_SOLCO|nr:hypothetical protein H5410_006927 [Solanum commersonii]
MPSLTSIKSSIAPQPTIIAGHTAQLLTIIVEHITTMADQTTIDVQFGTSEERITHDYPIINNEQTPLPTRSSSSQPPIFELKHPFIFDLISGNYDIPLWDAFRSWVRDGLLTKHDKKKHDQDHYKKHLAHFSAAINLGVLLINNKNWFYNLYFEGQLLNNLHIDVIFYYLRKKANSKISSIWEKYLDLDNDVGCADEEHVIGEYIRGYIMHAAIPWHMVDHVFVLVHVKNKFHWVLAVISLNDKRINVYDSYRAAGHDAAIKTEIVRLSQLIPLKLSVNDYYKNKGIDVSQAQEENEFFDIVFIDNVPQQTHGTLDCGIYMLAFAEYLSYEQGIPAGNLDASFLRSRYATLLWNYGQQRMMSEQ